MRRIFLPPMLVVVSGEKFFLKLYLGWGEDNLFVPFGENLIEELGAGAAEISAPQVPGRRSVDLVQALWINNRMILCLTAASRACLLDSTQPGSLAHDVLAGAPVVPRTGDPPGGLYEVNCSDTDCRELIAVASKRCPDALREIEAEMTRQTRA